MHLKHEYIVIGAVSLILIFYTALAVWGIFPGLVLMLFSLSPVLVIWMVWVVLKHGTYNGPELKEGEEFGYADWDHRRKSE
jgi:hypothetical protein